jgi:predicted RNA-binding Zn ribbon-like protein
LLVAQKVRPDQPVAVELVSTIHVEDGEVVDALSSPRDLAEWIGANADRLPAGVRGAEALDELRSLRDTVRRLFQAATEGRPADPDDVKAVNALAATPPPYVALVWPRRGRPRGESVRVVDELATLLGFVARDAVEVLTGGHGELQACGAPSCVLFFVRNHPRQAWCSASCGNRARVARHYHRTRGS